MIQADTRRRCGCNPMTGSYCPRGAVLREAKVATYGAVITAADDTRFESERVAIEDRYSKATAAWHQHLEEGAADEPDAPWNRRRKGEEDTHPDDASLPDPFPAAPVPPLKLEV